MFDCLACQEKAETAKAAMEDGKMPPGRYVSVVESDQRVEPWMLEVLPQGRASLGEIVAATERFDREQIEEAVLATRDGTKLAAVLERVDSGS